MRLPLLIVLVLGFCLPPAGIAGPPLLTDDPGILDPGSLEIIAAVIGEQRSGGQAVHSPLLDVSAGLTENMQLSLTYLQAPAEAEGDEAASGRDIAALGYKWRIMSGSGWEMALACNYEFPVPKKTGFADDGTRSLGLPVLVSYSRDDWNWHGLAGWRIGNDGGRAWEYGLAVSHPLTGSTQWMAEVFGFASGALRENFLSFNLGLDYEFRPELHLLASAGSRLGAGPDPEDELELAFFVGLQWFK